MSTEDDCAKSSAANLPYCLPDNCKFTQGSKGLELSWKRTPQRVLVIHKPGEDWVLQGFKSVITWFVEKRGMCVCVERWALEKLHAEEDPILQPYLMKPGSNPNPSSIGILSVSPPGRSFCGATVGGPGELTPPTPCIIEFDRNWIRSHMIDLVVCLGGDGTLLHTSSMFQTMTPPIIAFHMGSLGFLTPFELRNLAYLMPRVLESKSPCLLRTRLHCRLIKASAANQTRISIETNKDMSSMPRNSSSAMPQCAPSRLNSVLGDDFGVQVLNDVVIHRGINSFICNLRLAVNGKEVTHVQGDGLIVSTPTGSTAYAMSTGASMIHPNVLAMLIAPISPHSLSFRPVVLPAGAEVEISLAEEARTDALVCFDGRAPHLLEQGDRVIITISDYPVVSVCCEDQVSDWFTSLASCLHWNVRHRQNTGPRIRTSTADIFGELHISLPQRPHSPQNGFIIPDNVDEPEASPPI